MDDINYTCKALIDKGDAVVVLELFEQAVDLALELRLQDRTFALNVCDQRAVLERRHDVASREVVELVCNVEANLLQKLVIDRLQAATIAPAFGFRGGRCDREAEANGFLGGSSGIQGWAARWARWRRRMRW